MRTHDSLNSTFDIGIRWLRRAAARWLAGSMALFIGAVSALALNPSSPPGKNFDLGHWYLKIPDSAASSISTAQLVGGYTSEWFYTGADGAMVFWCPVTGGVPTNSLSDFSRSELREVLNPSNWASNWTAFGTHVLKAQCTVTQVASIKSVIIGQIHAYTTNRPLVKLEYVDGVIQAFVKGSPSVSNDLPALTFSTVGLNALITYQIALVDGVVSVSVNGSTQSVNIVETDPAWTNHTFYFKAGAYSQDNVGPSTEGVRVAFYQLTASHAATPPPSLAAPTNLTATAVSSNEVDLTWTDNALNETAFQVERSTNGTSFLQIKVLSANTANLQDLSVSPATTYYYRIRATNASLFSSYSGVAQATTPPVSSTPADTNAPAASVLKVTAIATNGATLAWTAPGDDNNTGTAARYELRYDTSSISQSGFSNATLAPNLPVPLPAGSTQSVVLAGLKAATRYYFALRTADEANNISPLSNVPSATTLPTLPAPPTNLRATVISSNQIGLDWTDNSSNEDGFKIERATNSLSFAPLGTVGPSVTNFIDGTAQIGITNQYRVRAYNVTGDSANSNTNSAKAFVAPSLLTVLIASNSAWKYLDNGSDQGSAWQALAFDDSRWASGPAPLGYDQGEATTVSYGANSSLKYVTTYFRRKFSVVDPGNFSSLSLSVRRDDGAVVYLNGQEVFRSNMPTGAVGYLTFAASSVSSPDDQTFFAAPPIDPALLVNGDNVVAVEIHQRNRTSSDLAFNLALTTVARSLPIRMNAVAAPAGQVTFQWSPILGKTYRIQYATNFTSHVWVTLGEDIIPTVSPASVTRRIDVPGQRFYRVLLLD